MRTNAERPENKRSAHSDSRQLGAQTAIRTPLSTSPIKQCSQRQFPKPNPHSQLLSTQQALRQALQSEEALEAEREEMLSVVTNLKDRHRLEAIFEQERRAASHRLLALSNTASSKPGEES